MTRQFLPGVVLWSVAIVIAISVASMTSAVSQTHGAHVHGEGVLDIIVEGDRVELELELPGRDIVGFEYTPRTQEGSHTLEAAVKIFKDHQRLFRFPVNAACSGQAVSIESDQLTGGDSHDEHAEFRARYAFKCENPLALDAMDVLVFDVFPAIEEIKVRALSPRGQYVGEINPGSTRLEF